MENPMSFEEENELLQRLVEAVNDLLPENCRAAIFLQPRGMPVGMASTMHPRDLALAMVTLLGGVSAKAQSKANKARFN